MFQLFGSMAWPVTKWAEHSQQRACRNAMVASTALTAGRTEWNEAQTFVQAALARRTAPESVRGARI